MQDNFPGVIDDAHVDGSGVQIDPAVECVRLVVEPHHGLLWNGSGSGSGGHHVVRGAPVRFSYPDREECSRFHEQLRQGELMAAKQQDIQQPDRENHERQQLNALIGTHVIRTLGQPGSLHKVQVRALWEGHYRVNVFVGVDAASVKVAHSYFLMADSDGNIITSNPAIRRQYG
jgi:hypothetical protein